MNRVIRGLTGWLVLLALTVIIIKLDVPRRGRHDGPLPFPYSLNEAGGLSHFIMGSFAPVWFAALYRFLNHKDSPKTAKYFAAIADFGSMTIWETAHSQFKIFFIPKAPYFNWYHVACEVTGIVVFLILAWPLFADATQLASDLGAQFRGWVGRTFCRRG